MIDKSVKVLLVEDDLVDVESVKRAFKKNGIENELFHAQDGFEALEMLQGEHPEKKIEAPMLLLVDINMPRMNGIELIANIRADKDLRHLLIFVLTTSDYEKDKTDAYALNVAGYILKSGKTDGFNSMVSMLKHYWEVVEFP